MIHILISFPHPYKTFERNESEMPLETHVQIVLSDNRMEGNIS